MRNAYILVAGAEYEGASPVKVYRSKIAAQRALNEIAPLDSYRACPNDYWHDSAVDGRARTRTTESGKADYYEILEVPIE